MAGLARATIPFSSTARSTSPPPGATENGADGGWYVTVTKLVMVVGALDARIVAGSEAETETGGAAAVVRMGTACLQPA
jgi:hypothetical protein